LQNSLGGNAKTIIILTVSAAKRHLAETLSTLRFGARARQIQVRATVNRSVLEDQAQMKRQFSRAVKDNQELQEVIAALQAELFQLRSSAPSASAAAAAAVASFVPASSSSTYAATTVGGDAGGNICEICREFVSLKLRDSGGGAKGAAKASSGIAEQRSGGIAAIDTTFHSAALTTAQEHGQETEEEEGYSGIEPIERCAICGLSADEAAKLALYTGENLGEMFSCDGNCGHQFHVRCVGKSLCFLLCFFFFAFCCLLFAVLLFCCFAFCSFCFKRL
jgi:hypothetical protein